MKNEMILSDTFDDVYQEIDTLIKQKKEDECKDVLLCTGFDKFATFHQHLLYLVFLQIYSYHDKISNITGIYFKRLLTCFHIQIKQDKLHRNSNRKQAAGSIS